MRPWMLSLASVVLGLAVTPALADTGPGVVIVVGTVPAKDLTVVTTAVTSAARNAGWTVVDKHLTGAQSIAVLDCLIGTEPWPCLTAALGKDVEKLIVVHVASDHGPDGGPATTLAEQIMVTGSDVASSDQRACPRCADAALTSAAFDLTKSLLGEAAAGTSRTTLAITSTPPGAWITLDAKTVGATDHTYPVAPGPHTVMVQRLGSETEVRTVTARENENTPVAFQLHAGNGQIVVPPVVDHPHPHVVPGLVIGVGVVALVGGSVISLEADGPGKGHPQPTYLYSGPGIGLAVAGGVAAVVGGWLWHRASQTQAAMAVSAPTVSISAQGTVLGWTGSF